MYLIFATEDVWGQPGVLVGHLPACPNSHLPPFLHSAVTHRKHHPGALLTTRFWVFLPILEYNRELESERRREV